MAKNELICLALVYHQQSYAYAMSEFLQSLGLNQWAHISKPSLYTALRRLEKEGCLNVNQVRVGEMPERKIYSITPLGIERFRKECRDGLISVDSGEDLFALALTFNTVLEPSESILALQERKRRLCSLHSELQEKLQKTQEHQVRHSEILCQMGMDVKELEIRATDECIELYQNDPEFFTVRLKKLYTGMMAQYA
ncbi:MAG: PadR family transcriptional regulator [Spirochaetales bacterium]|nr:PadR family transcriptional regulator [Spirochaetales bacterium]